MNAWMFPLLWWCWDRQSASTYIRYRKTLRNQERLSAASLRQLQWERFTALLHHAYDTVPYYRRTFESAAVRPEDIRRPDDLARIPALTRQQVQDNFEDMVSSECDRRTLRRNATGGSTGTPMAFYDDGEHDAQQVAVKARADAWRGCRPGDKVAVIWGADRDIPSLDWFSSFRVHRVLRQRWLNSYGLTVDNMRAFADLLRRWRPTHIHAYAASLYVFAQFLQQQGRHGIRPSSVSTSAEKLWPEQRSLIEDVFGCRVFEFYGGREAPGIAAECEQHCGLHVFIDNVYLELLTDGRPTRPGEIGEVIVTPLTKRSMPLLRYRNGDLARAAEAPCPCGRPFPLLAEIVGRSNDVLVTPCGRLVHGAFFNHLFFGLPAVRQFQIHQHSPTDMRVSLVSDNTLPPEIIQNIRSQISTHMGAGMRVDVAQVDRIPVSPSGKYHYIISDVSGFRYPEPHAART